MKKVELLAPAGSLLKLKVAVDYGADAVYAGGKQFGLRTASENFEIDDFIEGAKYAHDHGAKLYVTINIYPRNEDIEPLIQYVKELATTGVDGVIVSDMAVFSIVKEYAPNLEIHISTQANNVNYLSAKEWVKMGAKRVVLARELSKDEIEHIVKNSGAQVEVFVHGAMCMSYSGRCLLSNYLAGRDSNKGDCAQPCRWKYTLMEEKREGEYFPIEEDTKGTFIFNSKDLCLIRRIPELIDMGVTSFKIEGRVKSEYYVAAVVSAYRRVIDNYLENPKKFVFDEKEYEEVCKVSHREYYEGFYNGNNQNGQITGSSSYIREYDFVAYTEGYDKERKLIIASQRNKFYSGEELDILIPKEKPYVFTPTKLYDEEMNEIFSAPHAQQRIYIPCEVEIPPHSMIRKKA